MIRFLMVSMLVVATGATAQSPRHTVDLDQPGALEALEKSNPQHFIKLQQLVEKTVSRDETTIAQVVRTAGGTEIQRGNLLRTSLPAKARLSFVLDDTRYVITVTVGADEPKRGDPGRKPR